MIYNEKEVVVRTVLGNKKEIISMPRDKPVTEAAKLMKENRVGSVLIKNDTIEGIITKGDIIYRVLGRALDPGIVLVDDVMTSPIAYVSADETLETCMLYMAKKNIERILVVEDNDLSKPLGIISTNDILKFAPGLLRIQRERLLIENVSGAPDTISFKGFCDDCGNYSEQLKIKNGYTLCPECSNPIIDEEPDEKIL
ncbi:MAG: CBS domain-containing protein [Candidatus Hodarchaeales archaeon]